MSFLSNGLVNSATTTASTPGRSSLHQSMSPSNIPHDLIRGDPWFEDGNLILAAEKHIFRVHRGVLARQSEIFQGMLEIPQPPPPPSSPGSSSMSVDSGMGVVILDGCQVVTMYDQPVELGNFLKAVYDGVIFRNRSLEDFYYMAGILRLATKYFVMPLRTKAIQHFTETWTYSLAGHDAMVERAISSPRMNGITYPYVHPLHVLNLARETNVRIAIPIAMYFLSVYPLAELIKGDHAKLNVVHPSRPSSQLSRDDLGYYTLMYQNRIDLILEFIRNFCGRRQASMACSSSGTGSVSCTKAFARVSSILSRSWMIRTSPLHLMMQASQEISKDQYVCPRCIEEFRADVSAKRSAIWDSLPGMVGLPDWETLKAEDLGSS